MTLLVRTLAVLGFALVAALVHSWAGPEIRLEPEATVAPGRTLTLPGGGDSSDGPGADAGAQAQDPGSDPPQEPEPSPDEGSAVEPEPDVSGDGERASSQPADRSQEALAPVEPMDPSTFGAEITLEQARYLHQFVGSGDVVFVDARGIREQYLEGHIAGAINLDTEDIATGSPVFQEFLFNPPDVWVVVYCIGGDCDESKHVKIDLADYGYESVFIFTDGYPAWERAGLPTATGASPWGE